MTANGSATQGLTSAVHCLTAAQQLTTDAPAVPQVVSTARQRMVNGFDSVS